MSNNNYYKLIPISYVYGPLPAYLFTFAVMFFSKTSNLLNIPFDKTTLYIFMRSFNSVLSFLIVPTSAFLFYKIFKSKAGTLLTFLVAALNWKLIAHAHYINADILLTLLLSLSFLTTYLYHTTKKTSLFTWLTGLLIGLAIGTKITAGLTLPLYLYIFLMKKDFRGMFALLFVALAAFIITNPFSLIFANDFAYRIYMMMFKEGGMVFDSVDYSPFKYIYALAFMATAPLLLFCLHGIITSWKQSKDKVFHVFLISNVILYLGFYSIQSRRVDRWLLPILPIVFIYGSYGFMSLFEKTKEAPLKIALYTISAAFFVYYLYFPSILLAQFNRNTPRSEAYLWMRENIPATANKLVYSEEGLDPMNKLPGTRVIKYEVYAPENAQFFMPEKPLGYDYIVLSSRSMENYKKEPVKNAYPFYYEKWNNFETTINDPKNFTLLKKFELTKPNLIPLSNILIYKRVGN